MGWESNSIFQVLIVTGSTGSGLFVYSPAPGRGNLIASITAISGTDPYGNAYLLGVTDYQPSAVAINLAVQNSGAAIFWYTAPVASNGAGPWTNAGGLSLLGGTLETTLFPVAVNNSLSVIGGLATDTETITSGQAGGLLLAVTNTTAAPTAPQVRISSQAAGDPALGIRITGDTANRLLLDDNGTTGGRIRAGSGTAALDVALYRAAANQWAGDYAAFNNAGAAETWQTVGGTGAAFAGTWANAAAPGVPLQYRRNMAPYKSAHWVGRVTNTVAQAAGSAITAAVAAAYRPTNTHDLIAFNITTGVAARVSIGSTGVLTCQSAIAANDVIGIADYSIGLDA